MTLRDALRVLLLAVLYGAGERLGSAIVDRMSAKDDEDETPTHTMPCPICEGTGCVRMRSEKKV